MRAKKIHPKRVGFIFGPPGFINSHELSCPFCARYVEDGHAKTCTIAKLQATIKRHEVTIRRLRKEAKFTLCLGWSGSWKLAASTRGLPCIALGN